MHFLSSNYVYPTKKKRTLFFLIIENGKTGKIHGKPDKAYDITTPNLNQTLSSMLTSIKTVEDEGVHLIRESMNIEETWFFLKKK